MGYMKSDDDWQAQDDARTLARANEIRSNSDRHGKAKAHAQKEMENLKKVAGQPGPSGGEILSKGYRKL